MNIHPLQCSGNLSQRRNLVKHSLIWSEHEEMVEDVIGNPWGRRKEVKVESLKYSQMSSQSGSKIECCQLVSEMQF